MPKEPSDEPERATPASDSPAGTLPQAALRASGPPNRAALQQAALQRSDPPTSGPPASDPPAATSQQRAALAASEPPPPAMSSAAEDDPRVTPWTTGGPPGSLAGADQRDRSFVDNARVLRYAWRSSSIWAARRGRDPGPYRRRWVASGDTVVRDGRDPDGQAVGHGCARRQAPSPPAFSPMATAIRLARRQPSAAAMAALRAAMAALGRRCGGSPGGNGDRPGGDGPGGDGPGGGNGTPRNGGGERRPRDRPGESALGPAITASCLNLQARTFIQRLGVRITPLAVGTCDHRNEEPGYRLSRRLRHLIAARTVCCSAPGCRRAAARCDFDHTIAYEAGGRSCECNVRPLCRRHHRCKQAPRWALEQPNPGTMIWTTPACRSTRPKPPFTTSDRHRQKPVRTSPRLDGRRWTARRVEGRRDGRGRPPGLDGRQG